MIFLTNLGEMKIKVSLFIGLKKEKKIKDSEAQFQVRRKCRQFQVEKKNAGNIGSENMPTISGANNMPGKMVASFGRKKCGSF